MFSRGHGKSHGHGKPKKESGSKKHHIRNWTQSRKKKKEANLFAWPGAIYGTGITRVKTTQGGRAFLGFRPDSFTATVDGSWLPSLVVVMMSGDSSSHVQPSVSSTGIDMLDDARLAKITSTTVGAKTSKPIDVDAEAIEEAVPIVQETVPVPESIPKIEKNGLDNSTTKPLNQVEDDSCIVNCIYFAQQCCECTLQ